MPAHRDRELIKESEWMRVYKVDAVTLMYESKFLVDHLAVSTDSIRRRWPDLSEEEKLEFALAFQAKPEVTPEDESVLDFLMEVADRPIWITIAPLLPRYSDRKRALKFLLDRISEDGIPKANFYQAVEQLSDRTALPILQMMYEAYENKLREYGELSGEFEYRDYLSCCKALWVIDGSAQYKEAIERFSTSKDESVKFWAEALLRNK